MSVNIALWESKDMGNGKEQKEIHRRSRPILVTLFLETFLLVTVSITWVPLPHTSSVLGLSEAIDGLRIIKQKHAETSWSYPDDRLSIEESGSLDGMAFSYQFIYRKNPFEMKVEEIDSGELRHSQYVQDGDEYELIKDEDERSIIPFSEVERVRKENYDSYFGFDALEEIERKIELLRFLFARPSSITSQELSKTREGDIHIRLAGRLNEEGTLASFGFDYRDYLLVYQEAIEVSEALSSRYSYTFSIE